MTTDPALEMPQPSLPDAVEQFLQMSVVLTGFDRIELLGTGMVRPYYDELLRIIGEREAGKLLAAVDEVIADCEEPGGDLDAAFEERILDDDRFGPVARNLAMMWYLGSWTQLPRAWRDRYGATSLDYDRVVSAAAYREGLVWPAAGTHPMGAKQQGFGAWSLPSHLPATMALRPRSSADREA